MAQADIWAPVLYVALLIGSLGIFSHFYRKRLSARRKFEPWYPTHPERDLYVSLLQADPPVHHSLLKAALLRRATADVARIVRIREDKMALQALVQKGSVGDDLWNSCVSAEKELEAEVVEVVEEANTFRPGWGQFIFASAGEIMTHEKIKESLSKLPALREETEAKYGIKKPAPTIQVSNSITSEPSPSATSSPSKLQPPISPSNGSAQLSDGESATSNSPSASRKSGGKKGKKKK